MSNTPYSRPLHDMTAAQVWAAWKAQLLTVGELAAWQSHHEIYFDSLGRTIPPSRSEAP